MPGAGLTIDIAQLPAWLNTVQRALGSMIFTEVLSGSGKTVSQVVISFTKRNFSRSASPDGAAWTPLKMRQGKPLWDKGLLVGSIGSVMETGETTLTVGTNLDYAATHQYGAVITPKNARALAIPITPQAKRSGGPRSMNLKLVWPKGRSSGYLVEERAGKGRFRARTNIHFILTSKAVIPARPFLGWNAEMADDASALVGDYVMGKLEGL